MASSSLLDAVDALGLEFERMEMSLNQMSHRLELEFANSARDGGANLFKIVQRIKRVSEMLPLLRERVAADLAAKQSVLDHAARNLIPAREILRSILANAGSVPLPDEDDPVLQRYLTVSRECEQQISAFSSLGFRSSDVGGMDGLLTASDLNFELLRTALPTAPVAGPSGARDEEEERAHAAAAEATRAPAAAAAVAALATTGGRGIAPAPPQAAAARHMEPPRAQPQQAAAKPRGKAPGQALVLAAPPGAKPARPGTASGKAAAAEKPAYPPIEASEFEKLPGSIRGACKLSGVNQLLEEVWRHFYGPGARRPGARAPLTSGDLKAMGVENTSTDPRLQALKALKRVALGKHGYTWAGPAPGKENAERPRTAC
eukprot:tig00020806_g14042.t1